MSKPTIFVLVFLLSVPLLSQAKPIKSEPLTGAGSARQVAFWTGGSVLGGDESLVWDSAGKRLGLGTASPSATLDIYNYFREVGSSKIFGLRSVVYANDSAATVYGGYFNSSSDSSVSSSYGVYARSNPENWEGESVGVYGESDDVGVKGVGDVGLYASSPYGRYAVIADNNLRIGSPEKPRGITLYDTENDNPFCVTVVNGSLTTAPGECN